eukprot:365032-Chlamydomonas_euryale.AAC.9
MTSTTDELDDCIGFLASRRADVSVPSGATQPRSGCQAAAAAEAAAVAEAAAAAAGVARRRGVWEPRLPNARRRDPLACGAASASKLRIFQRLDTPHLRGWIWAHGACAARQLQGRKTQGSSMGFCLFVHTPAGLQACLSACVKACLPEGLLAALHACMHASMHSCMHA